MARFEGRLWLRSDEKNKMPAQLEVSERVVLTAAGSNIGNWSPSEISAISHPGGVALSVEGQELIFESPASGLLAALASAGVGGSDLASRLRNAQTAQPGAAAQAVNPSPPPSVAHQKPWWQRWWAIATAVVVVISAISRGGNESGGSAGPNAAGTATEVTSERSAPTLATPTTSGTSLTTRATTTTTPTAPEWQSFTVTGQGDDVVDLAIPGDEPAILEISHQGSGNFSIVSYSRGGEYLDLLVNTIGSYAGTRPINFLVGSEAGVLEITAGGSWTVNVKPLDEAFSMGSETQGTGDTVLILEGTGNRLAAAHNGDSNFVVVGYSEGWDLLVNEIGSYEGTVLLSPDTFVIEVQADGNWSLVLS